MVGIGIVILILGLIALWNVVDATLVTVVFVGVMVLFAGIAQIVGAFVMGGSTGLRVLLGLLGVLYVIVGFNVVADPLRGAVALTIFIAIALVVDGIIRLIGAFSSATQHRGLTATVAVINILLGIWLWMGIPVSGLAIGLFVGLQPFSQGSSGSSVASWPGPCRRRRPPRARPADGGCRARRHWRRVAVR